MNSTESDFDVFLTVLPVIHALLAKPGYPNRKLLLKALHIWTQPPGSSRLRLHPTEKMEILADMLEHVREDCRFSVDEERFRIAVLEIRERSPYFTPNSNQ